MRSKYYRPVPVSVTVWGLVKAMSVNVSDPVTGPAAVGEKDTPTVQVPPPATVVPHVLLATLNPALATTEPIVRAPLR